MIKVYMAIFYFSAFGSAVGAMLFWLKKRTRVRHNCKTCAHCSLIEPGTDGKLIYTCGCEYRAEEKKHYYDYAVPVYCGSWVRRKGLWFPEEVDDDG